MTSDEQAQDNSFSAAVGAQRTAAGMRLLIGHAGGCGKGGRAIGHKTLRAALPCRGADGHPAMNAARPRERKRAAAGRLADYEIQPLAGLRVRESGGSGIRAKRQLERVAEAGIE